MVRQGKYTKKRSVFYRARAAFKRRWVWFKKLSKPKKALVIATPLIGFLLITPLVTYAYFYNDIADKSRLMNRNNTGIVLYDRNGEELYSTGNAKHRDIVPLAEISESTKQALLSSEDKDFYKHSGFSLFSILKALYANIITRDATGYGGSTLTQQLAKNTLLSTNQTYLRKYQELVVAIAIEQRYSKDEIFEMYLNSVYFGNNSFGILEASENYFGKKPSELTLAESSMLVGVLPAPSAYSPVEGSMKYAKERQETVLGRMVKNEVISTAEKAVAEKQELVYMPLKAIDNIAPHYTEMVLERLYEKYGEETVKRSGYQVTTTLDKGLQQAASAAVANSAANIQSMGGTNAGVVAIDPTNGQVRALVGSLDYANETFGKVNMATSPRQTGSSFKPIYYARALAEDLVAPASIIKDEQTDFGGYAPVNATHRFYGNVSVRQALNWSLNIPAVKIMEKTGVEGALDQAKKLGITTLGDDASKYGLSLALGAGEVPLLEMTNAYATFADEGVYKPAEFIEVIESKFNKKIYTAKVTSTSQAISKQGAYLISNVLSDAPAKTLMFGSSLNVQGTDGKTKTVAVKTGTTDDMRDGWTIGYTPEITVGVWVGNNDNTPMRSGGTGMAAPVWRSVMKAAIGSSEPSFAEPTGVVYQESCIGGVRTSDYFLLSTKLAVSCQGVPQQTAPEVKQPEPEKPPEPTNPPENSGSGEDEPTPEIPDTGEEVTPPVEPTPAPVSP